MFIDLCLYLNVLVVFPTFFKFKFGNKEFMIWATVSSWSYFGWLYRASPSLAAKNIINLLSVLTLWWGLCVVSSFVLLEVGVCYNQSILLAKQCLHLPCFILYSKAKFACYSRCLLTCYFCIPVPYNEKGILFFLGGRVLFYLRGRQNHWGAQFQEQWWD